MELRQYPLAIIRLMWIVLNNCYATFPYLIWMLLLAPLRYVKPKWHWMIEGKLFYWLMATCASWVWSCGHTLKEVGDDISPLYDDESLVIANHLATGDTAILMYALQNHGRVTNDVLWIMYIIFKYANFGWVSMVHGDFFINMGKETLVHLEKHLKTIYRGRDRKWIVLFPEGTFLRKGKASSQKYARKMGYPVLENLSLPRMGAMQTILDTLNVNESDNGHKSKKIKYIIDVTIGYPENIPLDIYNVIFHLLPSREITLLYRVFPMSEVPTEPDKLQDWTFALWEEKDKLLEEFYRTGSFPEIAESRRSKEAKRLVKSRRVSYSVPYMIFIQLLFIAFAYVQYLMFKNVLSFIF